ncbi:MAG: hypothetical protein HOO86_03100 [Bacteroidales bacterium]|nr:hypothetical protein [Bacteroidales bacterium]
MIKRLVFLLLVVIQSAGIIAQHDANSSHRSKYDANDHKLALVVHYGLFSNVSNDGWRNFVSTYNESTKPVTPLTDFNNKLNVDLGLRYGSQKIYLVLLWQHTHNQCEAGFAFQESRRFDFISNTIAMGAGFRLLKLMHERLNTYGIANLRFGGHSRIVSSYVYRDGFQSVGSDKDLNGTYLNSGVLGNELGILINYRLYRGLKLEFQAIRQSSNRIAPSDWGDISNYKALNTGNNFGMLTLPEDYKTYMEMGGAEYVLANKKYIKSDFRGYKMSVGLSLLF